MVLRQRSERKIQQRAQSHSFQPIGQGKQKDARTLLLQPSHFSRQDNPRKSQRHIQKVSNLLLFSNFLYSGNDRVSILDSITFEKKFVPGPQSKLNPNKELLLEKTPYYVNMSKSMGRIQSAKNFKSKLPGPSTYNTSKCWEKQSSVRSTINIGFSGYGKNTNLNVIPTKDKLKIKSERFID